MLIRKFDILDAPEISSVIRRSILNRDNRGYTLEQLYSIANYYCAENLCSELDKKMTYVCVVNGKIVGTATLRIDEIMAVFITPEYQGNGIGKRFMRLLEDEAVKRGLSRVWLVSGLFTVPFYESLGYKFVRKKIHPSWGKASVMEKFL